MKSIYSLSLPPWCAKDIKFRLPCVLFLLLSTAFLTNAQSFFIPSDKDVRFNSQLSPTNNPDLSPQFNPMMSPQFNSKLNPMFNSDINPLFNTAINPYFNAELNPLYNKELDPKYNPDIHPSYSVDGVVYNLESKVAALLFIAWPDRVLVEFDTNYTFRGYWVTNGQGGYNFFDTSGDFKNIMMHPNGKGGFNIFNGDAWIGFSL